MFKEYITAPIDPIPVEYVNTLHRLNNEPDYSLTSLGVAMLKPRFESYPGIVGEYYVKPSKKELYDRMIIAYDNMNEGVQFNYFVYTGDEDYDTDEYKGLKRKQTVEQLIKDKAETDCTVFYAEDKNFATIIIKSRDIKLYHLLTSFLPLYYPILFKAKPATPEEHDLIKSLSKKDRDAFVAKLQVLVYPYAKEFRLLQLSSLLRNMHTQKINKAANDVEAMRRQADVKRDEYADAIAQLKRFIVEFEGLKATEKYDEAEDELVQYLADNKKIRNVKVEGNKIKFAVLTELQNFNEEVWELFAERGGIFDGEYKDANLLDVFKNEDNRKLILNSIFSDKPEFIIKLAGNYTLDMYNCNATVYGGYNYEEIGPEFKNALPNPHLKIFECLGGYRERIPEALRQREYISAIEMCVMSAGSIDLDETEQTFRPFLGWLLSSENKVLRHKDGTEMTPEEALVWLLDHKKG